MLEEQRRLKREQEEADTASRRHTGIVPTRHQFITNERFGDLLNVTDNSEKRKSGVEVPAQRFPILSFCKQENASRASSVCERLSRLSRWRRQRRGASAGFFEGTRDCGPNVSRIKTSNWDAPALNFDAKCVRFSFSQCKKNTIFPSEECLPALRANVMLD